MRRLIAPVLFSLSAVASAAPVVTAQTNATTLVNNLLGTGVKLTSATLSYDTAKPAGLFTNGKTDVGIDRGIVLSTGDATCVAKNAECNGSGTYSSLKFNFTTSVKGVLSTSYVFASEEYPAYVNKGFNDVFQLLLDGKNIALLPDRKSAVSIDTVNCSTNNSYYRSNNGSDGCKNQNLDFAFGGLTQVLSATSWLNAGTHSFELLIKDVGDAKLDSAVFMQAGSFKVTKVPEPGALALVGIALFGLAAARRRQAV